MSLAVFFFYSYIIYIMCVYIYAVEREKPQVFLINVINPWCEWTKQRKQDKNN